MSYQTIETTSGQDQAVTYQGEKSKIGQMSQNTNPFYDSLNLASQVLGPVAYETLNQNGNDDAALVLSTAVNGVDSSVAEMNAMTDPYNTPYAYGGTPAPYSPYSSSGGVSTTMGSMTTSGGVQTTSSSMSTGGTTDLQNSVNELDTSQMEMMSMQYEIGMKTIYWNTMSTILKDSHDLQLNTVRNMKVA